LNYLAIPSISARRSIRYTDRFDASSFRGSFMPSPIPASIDATVELLQGGEYIADRSLATVLYLALKLGRPLFCEGEAGVGKTEIAKVLAETLRRRCTSGTTRAR
jgi:MoxR-like ATPase